MGSRRRGTGLEEGDLTFAESTSRRVPEGAGTPPLELPAGVMLEQMMERVERQLIENTLRRCHYLGLPAVNPAGYQAGSNLALAGNLQGLLKMMHGSSNVSASLSTTMRMADALIRAGKHFELLIMPGQPHTPRPPADRYSFDDIQLFFVRTLGGPR